ncbi:hypothetical protein GOP47_0001933 [Adiantum capillus-veneris]|uniref:Uncharacterized protein n=1 Tax=Adiantum capillus-veneris TaxID=13818 RepID=A0A9D4V9Z1_ADICA|nr:hypothetical protein GOP47_0001933 [Adiantum capillus-veneris]
MVRPKSLLCENCEEESLQWCPEVNEAEGGFLCPSWRSYSSGVGCFRVITTEEFIERCRRQEEVEGYQDENEEDLAPHYCKKKAQNVAALLSGELVVLRQPLLPKVLSISDCVDVIRKPFKSPCPGVNSETTAELLRRLNARKRFVPWCSSRESSSHITPLLPPLYSDVGSDTTEELPPGIEPLVLWDPEEQGKLDEKLMPIIVDPHLVRFLRPHQRNGVQFMFECVSGLREFSKSNSSLAGCILADDMGLGKTLQSITLLWTLLKQGFDGSPMAKKVLIVTPTSLVSNWESEIQKWLGGQVRVIALCESTRADVISGISAFLAAGSAYQVLILSYETFRMHAKKLQQTGSCDLLICDEAHRLKNDQTRTNKALAGLQCNRRVLLSGTPMQNDLEEFFAMVNFTNPGILGNAASFRRYFEAPILNGREPNASEEDKTRGAERSAELSDKVNQFILRRTNALLSNHLPPKIIEIVCCKLTNVQEKLYQHFVRSKNLRQVIQDSTKRARVLSSILALKKLCNHPKLIYDTAKCGSNAAGFEDCLELIPSEMFAGRNKSWTGADGNWIKLSGKMSVLARLLENIRQKTNDRIVLVSNYTQTLELFAQLCREKNYPYLKLDGTTSISKRQKLVQKFNNPMENEFAFLLSSKAGGCGLNLIGGNRLVLFDPDWNPANDKQAAARVWRDGQKKRVFIYRFLTAGTIEEKVFERQLSKEGLQKVVEHQEIDENHPQGTWLSSEELRDLFSLHENAESNIHDNLNCKRCPSGDTSDCSVGDSADAEEDTDIGAFANVAGCLRNQRPWEKQIGAPLEEDLKSWAHHSHPGTVPDEILQLAAGDEISFVFTCQIDGKLVPVESNCPDIRKENSALSRDGQQTKVGLRRGLQPIQGQNLLSWPSRKKLMSNPGKAASSSHCLSTRPPKSTNVQQKPDSDDEFM